MDLQLDGMRCLVTGASCGIGRAIALVLAEEGARVAVVARRKNLLEELAEEIIAKGKEKPLIICEDLGRDGGIDAIHNAMVSGFGGVDVLVNNAGGSRPVRWDASEAEWEEGIQLNFTQVRRMTNKVVPDMRSQNWGRIINITGNNEPLGVNIASGAKAMLHNWAKGLSRELAKDGITVNSLPPGRINSEQILERLHPTAENRTSFIEANIPIGYFGEPRDMAVLVAFLASPLSRYITGEVIHVDGGMRRDAG